MYKLITNWWAWELGNWCHERLVGAPQKYQAQQGDSMATFWAGTSHGSGHQPALSHRRNFSGETYLTQYLPWTTFCEGWQLGWALHWQNRWPKQWSIKLNWASKLQIWWPKQWSIQCSDPQISAKQTTAIMLPRAHMEAHGKASPWGHPTDYRDLRQMSRQSSSNIAFYYKGMNSR